MCGVLREWKFKTYLMCEDKIKPVSLFGDNKKNNNKKTNFFLSLYVVYLRNILLYFRSHISTRFLISAIFGDII